MDFQDAHAHSKIHFATAVVNNKIYCIGGITQYKVPNATFAATTDVYNPVTDTWETKAAMPMSQFQLQANVVNGKIYLIGGDPNLTINEVYDPATDSWTTKTSMPTPASTYASGVFRNKIYIIGGYYSVKLTQIYDPETDTWASGAPAPNGVIGIGAATVGVLAPRRIYCLSYIETGRMEKTRTNQIYDPLNDTWALGSDVPLDHIDFGVAVLNDRIYAIGGTVRNYPIVFSDSIYTDTPSAVNEVYTPAGYGTPDPSYVQELTPPKINITSPINQTYNQTSVTLTFTADKLVNWASYSLDGNENVSFITGDANVTKLSAGLHNITVYAQDTYGNVAASKTIDFTIAEETKPQPFPSTIVALSVVAVVVVVGVGLIVYLRKIRR